MLAERIAARTSCTTTRALVVVVVVLVVLLITLKGAGYQVVPEGISSWGQGQGQGGNEAGPALDGEYEAAGPNSKVITATDENGQQVSIVIPASPDPKRPRRTSGRSKDEADELAEALRARIGDGRGPVIVGGIGDSGTRGVRDVLQHLGVQMLGVGYVLAESKDSLIYMAQYPAINSRGQRIPRGPAGLYNEPIARAHSLNYNESHISFDHYHMGRQWVAKMVGRSMSVSQQFRGKDKPLDPWGFKHPRTGLLLPYWTGTLGSKYLFIHVLRDGKDIMFVVSVAGETRREGPD